MSDPKTITRRPVEADRVSFRMPREPGDPVVVRRGAKEETFRMVEPDPAALSGFLSELDARIKVAQTLYEAEKRFASGQADYTNASANLRRLREQIDIAEVELRKAYLPFWGFTDADEERVRRIERLFSTQADLMVDMMLRLTGTFLLTEDERGN